MYELFRQFRLRVCDDVYLDVYLLDVLDQERDFRSVGRRIDHW